MKKVKTITSFVCQECGYDTPSWFGKCPECGAWNSLKEIRLVTSDKRQVTSGDVSLSYIKPQKLGEIAYKENARIRSEYEELNTVLGGGIVKGSVTLIAGDPGVGKSTLLLQLAIKLSENGSKVLYVSGEESVDQVKMRAERINSEHSENSARQRIRKSDMSDIQKRRNTESSEFSENSKSAENLFLLSLTDADQIVTQIEEMKPDLAIIDSIQTVESQNTSGLSGSVAQVRYSALQFVRSAKQNSIPVIIVGHVTKEGMVAGPMVLSHMVDTVLFLEGEKNEQVRILRSFKNRFGPVDEVGIFVMSDRGMSEAHNFEDFFQSKKISAPGSVRVVTFEGSRAFVIEIQALAVSTRLPMPRRVVSGMDPRRVELLLAVLQKHARLPVDMMDIFVNIAGGIKITDRAIDLGLCLAIYSSIRNVDLSKLVGIAEVGLMGELRPVPGLDKRIKEAKKLGLKSVVTAETHRSLKEVIGSLSQGKA